MKRYRDKELDDPYLDELKNEFRQYSFELKKLKHKLLKSNSTSDQSKIIKKMDNISAKMENNQKQSTKVIKSRLKDMKKSYKK
jgi:cell shape-determining protein MreC